QNHKVYGAQPPGSPFVRRFAHNGVEAPSAAGNTLEAKDLCPHLRGYDLQMWTNVNLSQQSWRHSSSPQRKLWVNEKTGFKPAYAGDINIPPRVHRVHI